MNVSLWRWAGILILSGGIIFWIGAFLPPWKQWMTSDVKEYLSIINARQINWYVIHGCFLLGIILSLLGMQLLSQALLASGANQLFSSLGATAYIFGSTFWVLNIAFRLTVTVWAANLLGQTNEVYESFTAWMDWSNLIFSIYMVMAYAGIGFLGGALRGMTWLPAWVGWFMMIFGFAGSVGYLARIPLFAPPLMVHFPLIIAGLFILLKRLNLE